MNEMKVVRRKHATLCLVCQETEPPGQMFRLRLTEGPSFAVFGYLHLDPCGPMMIQALRARPAGQRPPAPPARRRGRPPAGPAPRTA
jgi:hypothetical protein